MLTPREYQEKYDKWLKDEKFSFLPQDNLTVINKDLVRLDFRDKNEIDLSFLKVPLKQFREFKFTDVPNLESPFALYYNTSINSPNVVKLVITLLLEGEECTLWILLNEDLFKDYLKPYHYKLSSTEMEIYYPRDSSRKRYTVSSKCWIAGEQRWAGGSSLLTHIPTINKIIGRFN